MGAHAGITDIVYAIFLCMKASAMPIEALLHASSFMYSVGQEDAGVMNGG